MNIEKYLDPKYKFLIYKLAIDDVEDELWHCTETEEEAKQSVKNETEAYDSWDFQFRYKKRL